MNLRARFFCAILCVALCRCTTAPDSRSASVEIKGGLPNGIYVDQTFAGTGYRRFEGRTVVVQIGHPLLGERTGEGRAIVDKGSFRIEFPAVREKGLYKGFVFFFDMNGDRVCTPGKDIGFRGATGGNANPYVYWVDKGQISNMNEESCTQFD